MNLFKRKNKVKNRMLKALRDFNAVQEGYQVRKGEYIFITNEEEYHKILFITEERAKEFINKKINDEPIVEEVEF